MEAFDCRIGRAKCETGSLEGNLSCSGLVLILLGLRRRDSVMASRLDNGTEMEAVLVLQLPLSYYTAPQMRCWGYRKGRHNIDRAIE